jgi:DNA-binding protein HU-beta
VTKADVIAQISEKTGVDKGDVQQTLESFFTVVKDSLSEGENLYVRGFGSFINKKRARKVARNISKGTSMIIDEHFVPSFKPAKVFVEQVKVSDKLVAVK